MVAYAEPDLPQSPPSPGPAPEAVPPGQTARHQDSYRNVVLGQVSDPIFPSTSWPAGVSEEEFAQQAREDPGPRMRNRHHAPLLWRWLFLVILASIALSIVLAR
jgi:hypothetical protein